MIMNYIYSSRRLRTKGNKEGSKERNCLVMFASCASRCLLMQLEANTPHLLNIVPTLDRIPATFHFRLSFHRLLGRPIAQISAKVWPFTPIDLLSLFDKVVVHEVYSIFKSTFTRVQELILSSLVSSLIRDMEAKHLTPRSMSTLAQEWHLVTSHMVSREVSLSFIECR